MSTYLHIMIHLNITFNLNLNNYIKFRANAHKPPVMGTSICMGQIQKAPLNVISLGGALLYTSVSEAAPPKKLIHFAAKKLCYYKINLDQYHSWMVLRHNAPKTT
uniref:Uncharacterized protein n=1 Tax=Anguilla anguilla TaxID=7936 RepID=A0A0E9X733_ANGAN